MLQKTEVFELGNAPADAHQTWLGKAYKILEIIAMVVGKAKNK